MHKGTLSLTLFLHLFCCCGKQQAKNKTGGSECVLWINFECKYLSSAKQSPFIIVNKLTNNVTDTLQLSHSWAAPTKCATNIFINFQSPFSFRTAIHFIPVSKMPICYPIIYSIGAGIKCEAVNCIICFEIYDIPG